MPRGRLLKTKIKEARELEKARLIGAAKAEIQRIKLRAKNIGVILQSKLADMEVEDLAKFTAILGATVVIKNGIDFAEESYTKQDLAWWYRMFARKLLLLPPGTLIPDEQIQNMESLPAEITQWVISFGLAYVIVENFGEIVLATGQALTSLTGLARLLLGAGALIPA